MKKGTRVIWITAKGIHGSGVVIKCFMARAGQVPPVNHYLVAVDADPGEEHRVIYCAETWLKVGE